jgi:hypothetical protein
MRERVFALCWIAQALVAPTAAQEAPAPANPEPALAAPRGPVAHLMLSLDLLDAARGTKDAFAALAAARLSAGIEVTAVTRPAQGDPLPSPELTTLLPGAEAIFTQARDLAGEDETLIYLIDQSLIDLTTGRARISGVRASAASVAAGAEALWSLPFFAGAPAEVAVLGSGTSTLDLSVTDGAGNPVCLETGPADRAYCGFVPAENGSFTVTVRNPGRTAADLALITN